MIGPLQLVVIGFDEDKYARDIVLEIKELRKKGAIRLFDLLYLFKHEDGTIDSREVSDLEAEEQREFGTLIKSLIGLVSVDVEHADADEIADSIAGSHTEFGMSGDELQAVAEKLPNGSSGIFVAFEHVWARGFKEAVAKNNGRVVAQGMVDATTMKLAANELASVLDVIDKTEAASMEKMAEILAEAEAREDEARVHAAEMELEAESIEESAQDRMARAESLAELAAEVEEESLTREAAALEHAAEIEKEAEEREDEAFLEAEAVRRAAQRQKSEAMAEAAEVIQETEEIEAAAVLRAINALVIADIIEREAAQDALNAILAAKVIETAAAHRAARALSG